MNKLLIAICITLSACGPQKPDYVDEYGKEYFIVNKCIKSHNTYEWTYHYGYNEMKGMKWEWHFGPELKEICDSSATDTIQINKEKRFYSKK